jgi:hypothetical protein
MKTLRPSRFLAPLFVFSLLASAAEAREKRFHFRGTADGKLIVRMSIVRDDERISGSYLYEAVGDPIRFEGSIDGDGNLRWQQFAEGGVRTGGFDGTWKGKKIEGTWRRPEGNDSGVLFALETGTLPDDGVSGTYETVIFGTTPNQLYLLSLPGNRVKFRLIALATPEGATDPAFTAQGEISGIVRITGETAVFEGDDCRIQMRFVGREVRLAQTGSCGMPSPVSGSGSYRRRGLEVDLTLLAPN